VTVINDAPKYKNSFSGYANIDVRINKVATVIIPPFIDTENDFKLTVTDTTTALPLSLPFTNSLITIAPLDYN
jgi:hypothetical protein